MKTKYCPKCSTTKPIDQFHKNASRSDGHAGYCSSCVRNYDASVYGPEKLARMRVSKRSGKLRAKEAVYQYLSTHPCVDCGEADIVVLEFDHVRGEKTFGISVGMRLGYAVETIMAEISKCDVRCANCHKKRHARSSNTIRHRLSK